MKLAISTYSLSRWRRENNKTVEDSIDWMLDNGVKAVEFSGLDEKPGEDKLKRALHLRDYTLKKGMTVAGYCVGGEFLLSPAKQRDAVEAMKKEVDIAAAMGVKSMRHDVTRGFSDLNKDLTIPDTFPAALAVITPAVREIAEYGATKGVKTTLENHGFFMQASERVEDLIKHVGHPNYGLTMDMGNFLCVNEDPVKAVTRVAKYAVMVHTKDFHVKPKCQLPPSGWFATPTEIGLRGAIVGHGVINIRKQLEILKGVGYNHFLSLEFEGIEEPTFAVRTGLEFLRKHMSELGILED